MQPTATRDGHQHWSWPLPSFWGLPAAARSHHIAPWRQALLCEADRLGLLVQTPGTVLGEPLWLLTRAASASAAPHRLVACGFHGEEPAGPWGLLRFLQAADPANLDAVHLTLLPLVNCTGFAAGSRFNVEGDNPNRGFTGPGAAPSAEGRVLLQHATLLASASRDGLLSCHEDVLTDCAYVYALERADAPGPLARHLLQANLHHFKQHPDGLVDGCRVQDGIVFNHHDGSFEDWLFGLGAACAFCVETPGLQAFENRVAAQRDMIAAFIDGPSAAP
jgi:hypothetical protein